MKLAKLSLLSLLALPLAAQSTGFSVGGALIYAPKAYFGALDKVTHNDSGFLITGAYTLKASDSDVAGRVSVSYATLPGKAHGALGLSTDLNLLQLSGDVIFPTSVSNLSGVVGLSLNSYSVKNSGVESATASDVDNHFPVKDGKGLKGGFRVGVEYAFTKAVKAEILLQQTELGGQNAHDPVLRIGGVNPSWLQLGVSYSF